MSDRKPKMSDWKPTHRRKGSGDLVDACFRDGLWRIEGQRGEYKTLGPVVFSEWYEPIPKPAAEG